MRAVAVRAAVSFQVRGRVQGVGFRVFVARAGLARGLRGEVWNVTDGSVGGWAVGEGVEDFVAELWQGPGRVEVVVASELSGAPEGEGFQVSATRPPGWG